MMMTLKKRNRSDSIDDILFIAKSNAKYFSLYSSSNCAICQQQTNQNERIQCKKCFKIFHQKCYEDDNATVNECKFCFYSQNLLCCHCESKIFEREHIIIQCELCDNIMHYQCANLPLALMLSREYYANVFKETTEMKFFYYEFIKQVGNQYIESQLRNQNQNDIIRQIINSISYNLNYRREDLFDRIHKVFYICNFCKKKETLCLESLRNIGFKIYDKVLFNSISANVHEMYISIDKSEIKREVVKKRIESFEKAKIKKILAKLFYNDNSLQSKYLICKWSTGDYSIEHINFIQTFQNFNKLSIDYDTTYSYIDNVLLNKKKCSQLSFMNCVRKFSQSGNVGTDFFDKNALNHNLYIINEEAKINVMRKGIFFDLIHYIYSLKSESIKYPKMLIVVNSKSKKELWKNKFTNFSDELIVCSMSSKCKNCIYKIIYEFIYFTSENKISSSFYDIIQKNNANDVISYFREIKLESSQFIPDVLIITDDILNLQGVKDLLMFFNFNLFLFDIDSSFLDNNSQKNISSFINQIQYGANDNNNSLIYYLTESKSNTVYHLTSFISNMFISPKDIVIFNSLKMGFTFDTSKHLLNNNVKIIHCAQDAFAQSLLVNFNWELIYNKAALMFTNLLSQIKAKTEEIKPNMLVNYSYSSIPNFNVFSRTIVNFIPCSISKENCVNYINLIRNEFNNEMIINCNTFCSFPLFIDKSLTEEKISHRKIELLKQLIIKILNNSKRTNIIVIYSLKVHYSNENNMKTSFLNPYFIERIGHSNSISYYNIDDDDLYKRIDRIEDKTYIILFNVPLSSRNFALFYRKINEKNKLNKEMIILFQMYIKDLIEGNLVNLIYRNIEKYTQPNNINISLLNMLTKEEKEEIIIKNIDRVDIRNVDLNPKIVLSYENISQCEGMIYMNKSSYMYTTGNIGTQRQFDIKEYDIESALSNLIMNKKDIDTYEDMSIALKKQKLNDVEIDSYSYEEEEEEQEINYGMIGKEIYVVMNNSRNNFHKSKHIHEDNEEQAIHVSDSSSNLIVSELSNEDNYTLERLENLLNSMEKSPDNDTIIHNALIKIGFVEIIRKVFLLTLINSGLPNLKEIDVWCRIFNKNLETLKQKKIAISNEFIQFYYEYVLFHLSKQKYKYYPFLFFAKKLRDIKYRIDFIQRIKHFYAKGTLFDFVSPKINNVIRNLELIKEIDNNFIFNEENLNLLEYLMYNIMVLSCKIGFLKVNSIIKSDEMLGEAIHMKRNEISSKILGNDCSKEHFINFVTKLYIKVYQNFFEENATKDNITN